MFIKYNKTRENVASWKRFLPMDGEGTPVTYGIKIEYLDGQKKEIVFPTREERDRRLSDLDNLLNQPHALLDITPGSLPPHS
jgi:hypothetical protein